MKAVTGLMVISVFGAAFGCSSSDSDAANVPAANVPAANVPAPNVPAPNVPAPNVPAPNVPVPNVPAPNVPAPDIAENGLEVFIEVLAEPVGNGALGSLFQYESTDGSVRCAAGFVSSVGTTIYTNQNDIEFWCQETVEPPVLTWVTINPPIVGYPSTLLGNVNGFLFDFIEGSWFEERNMQWLTGAAPSSIVPGPAEQFRVTRHDANKIWLITSERLGCPGLSFHSGDGYYGTVLTDFVYGAASVWRGTAYTNFGGRIWASVLPDGPSTEGCVVLDAAVLSDIPVHAYAMLPVGDRLFIGGGGAPHLDAPAYDCAPILLVSDGQVQVIELDDCSEQQVTEIYSFILYADGLYVGTYPDGGIFRIDLDTLAATRTLLPILDSDIWVSPSGERYLESQSMAVVAGRLLVGMFPWGEIHDYAGTPRVFRPFSAPPKNSEPHPFSTDGQNNWSQRITSLVVLNGRVCAGTGNTFAERYDAGAHAFIDESLADEYGRVYCAALRNQTLGVGVPIAHALFSFYVTDTELIIERDGDLVAKHAHSLSSSALAALNDVGGLITLGRGPYGPSQATEITRR